MSQGHSRVNHALHRVQGRFFQAAMWAEVIIALFIFAAIAIQVWHLPSHLNASSHTQFTEFIQVVLDILMCLELIMMLCRHDLDSIIEVMIFAVTRTYSWCMIAMYMCCSAWLRSRCSLAYGSTSS